MFSIKYVATKKCFKVVSQPNFFRSRVVLLKAAQSCHFFLLNFGENMHVLVKNKSLFSCNTEDFKAPNKQ